MQQRKTFGSLFGTIAVVGGSVVGLGNIWRFPYIAGDSGGSAFILVYILMSLVISIPIMVTEIAIGRAGRGNARASFMRLSKDKRWQWVGLLGIFTAFIIISFYNVIAAWSIEFIRISIVHGFDGLSTAQISTMFNDFVSDGYAPISRIILFVLMTGGIIMLGVPKGIEKANQVLMPVIVLILVAMVVKATTLEGWSEGFHFLLDADFSKITWAVALQALGQSFFSMSLGLGAMIIFGSYLKSKTNIFEVAGAVAITDVCVAILSGLAIFPAVFTFDIEPSSGAELVFLTLPNVFARMSGGYFLSIVFFFLLLFAAISSSVSLFEVMASFLSEEFKVKRKYSTVIIMLAMIISSSLAALSQMPDSSIKIMGENLVSFYDKLSTIVLMPIGAMFTLIFAGWFLDKKVFTNELEQGMTKNKWLMNTTIFIVKYVAPLVIFMLFVSQIISQL